MDYYNKLNLAIQNSINDYGLQYHLKYFDEIVKLAYIVIENTPKLDLKEYSLNVSLNTSIQTVVNFFNSIKQEYSYMFQNILQEKNIYNDKEDYSVKFYKILDKNQTEEYDGQHRNNKSEVRKDGFVHIDYAENLDDIFTITHEITHKFSQPKNQDSTIKQFLGETSTITMEFLLQDYLFETTNYNSDEIITHKNNRLVETYDDAGAIIFENILLRLYRQNNNCITQDILLNYLNSIDKDSKIYELLSTKGEYYLNEIVKSGSLQFYKRQRYVIGTILASDFHKKIKNNPEKINQLCYLIDILGHTDLVSDSDLKILETLDIPIVNNGEIRINPDGMIRLSDCYKSEVNNALSYQNTSNYTK